MMDIFDANTSAWIFDTFQQHLKALSAVAVLMDNSAPALVGFSKLTRSSVPAVLFCTYMGSTGLLHSYRSLGLF